MQSTLSYLDYRIYHNLSKSNYRLVGIVKPFYTIIKNFTYNFLILYFLIMRSNSPLLNGITSGQNKSDKSNLLILLTDVFCVLLRNIVTSNL